MIIDKSHRTWGIATGLLLLLSTAFYIHYAHSSPDGPSGSSWQGLAFGIAGSLLMLFAGLFSARKKMPRWRIGTARIWLQGHIWLGLLSVPLILFHSGFRWGGLLTQVLLVLLGLIVVSGLFGLALQHVLPRMMKMTTPLEAIYEQVPHVCQSLTATADKLVAETCGGVLVGPAGGGDEAAALLEFHRGLLRPYLAADRPQKSPLHNPRQAEATFNRIRASLPEPKQAVVNALRGMCDERRQLAHQVRMHHWLHGWLFVHTPLSLALLILGIAHVVRTVYFS